MPVIYLLLLVSGLFAGQKYTICPSGCDFTTGQACEDNNTKSYAGVGKDTCYFRDEGTYTGAISIAGQTNIDANNNLMFKGLGLYKTIIRNSAAVTFAVSTSTAYTGFEDLQIQQRTSVVAGVLSFSPSTAGNGYTNRCFLNISGSSDAYGITYNGASNISITSSVLVAYSNTSSTWGLYNNSGGGSATIKNTTVIGFTRNYYITGGSTMSTINCIAIGRSTVADFGAGITQSYNISSDATASGTGSLINKTFSETMESDSIRIRLTSPAYKAGTDPIALGVATDIFGNVWKFASIGAHDPTPTTSKKCGRLWRMGLAPCGR